MTRRFLGILAVAGVAAVAVGCKEGAAPASPEASGGGQPTMSTGEGGGPGGTATATGDAPGDTLAVAGPGATCSGVALDSAGVGPMGIPLPGFKGGFGNSQLIVGPTVVQAVAPPAISGGTLVVLADDQTVVATDPDRDQIYVVDISARRVNATIALNPGDEPGRVISDSSGRVHVALRHAGALVTIDPVAGTVTDRRQVCAAPRGLAHDPTTDLIHVACAGGELVSLPAAGGDAVRRLKLDRDLRDVVVDGDRLLVSRFRAAEILTVDAKGNVSGRVGAGDFRSADARGGQLFTPSVAWRMVGVHGGGVAMVHQRGVDDEIQRGVAGHVAQGSYGGGPTIGGNQCHAIVHSAVTRMMPNGEVLSGPALADLPLPVDMAISADGKTVAIISAGNTTNSGQFGSFSSQSSLRNVHVTDMDSVSDAKTMSCRAEAGRTSCWAGGPTFCTSTPDVVGQAIAVAVTTSGTVIVQSREPAMLNVPYGASIPLSTTSREDTGQKLFHANAGAGLACASCHPEGSDDGRDWNFACAGRRRTQSLQTGIRGTEPFHWDGDEKDFPQLVADVFTGRMSGPELTPDQTDSVLTWIDHQPRPVKAAPVDAAAVERGRAVFDDTSKAGCVTCHAGPQLTNSKTMDVGTGGAFQVPSLVGLANHPPYLHNGCAQTLQDRFSPACGGGDKHGVTSRLGASEISDLISYLETL